MKIKFVFFAVFITICLYLIPSCKKSHQDTVSGVPVGPPISVGKSYEGGIIFYVDGTGSHGLISATSDIDSLIWGDTLHTNASGIAIGVGDTNTTTIINLFGSGNFAASACNLIVISGFNDWFLPSKVELNILYTQKDKVGGFKEKYYWTSSEASYKYAWGQYFGNGQKDYLNKFTKCSVRPVRAF